jgi:hypothetical protein
MRTPAMADFIALGRTESKCVIVRLTPGALVAFLSARAPLAFRRRVDGNMMKIIVLVALTFALIALAHRAPIKTPDPGG